jgi:hypothetical protein
MGYREETRDFLKFVPTITTGRQNYDTDLTSQETESKDCATMHTRGSTSRATTTGSCREALLIRP